MAKKVGECPVCKKDIVIDESLEYYTCPYCNNNFVRKNEPYTLKRGAAVKKLLIMIAIAIGILFFVSMVESCKDGALSQSFLRDITKDDYSYIDKEGIGSYSIIINPNTDIKEFTVSCVVYDSNDNVIYSDSITKYDLSENSSYTYTFDYGFANSLQGSYVRCSFEGKVRRI